MVYLAPRRVLVLIQVGVASLKQKKARLSTLLKFVFDCDTGCGEHSFDSSAEVAVGFEALFVYYSRCENQL